MSAPPVLRPRRIAMLEAELVEWATGSRSHWNEYCGMSSDGQNAASALCAVADAAEVAKLSAAIQALVAIQRAQR